MKLYKKPSDHQPRKEMSHAYSVKQSEEICKTLNACWIEDLYVKREIRNHGIASRAIAIAEKYAKEVMKAPAICMDVIPQNESAIKLYHSLGYDTVSMITLRKSISETKRSNPIQFLGYDFLNSLCDFDKRQDLERFWRFYYVNFFQIV